MGEFSNQLKKYLDETPKEVQEQHFFEIQCRMAGIDHTKPDAKRKLKRYNLKNHFRYTCWPFMVDLSLQILCVFTGFMSGVFACLGNNWLWIVLTIVSSALYAWGTERGKNNW